jgi:hypothetical protein
LQNTKFRETAS